MAHECNKIFQCYYVHATLIHLKVKKALPHHTQKPASSVSTIASTSPNHFNDSVFISNYFFLL